MLNYALHNELGREIPLVSINQVLHFYQGCDIVVREDDGWQLDTLEIASYLDDGRVEVWGKDHEAVPIKDIKLLLRNIEDMRENEEDEYYELCKQVLHLKNPNDEKENILTTADSGESFAWLIENRFDCFRLIPRALALDINNLPSSKSMRIKNVDEWYNTKQQNNGKT